MNTNQQYPVIDKLYEMCFNKPDSATTCDAWVKHEVEDDFLGNIWVQFQQLLAQLQDYEGALEYYTNLEHRTDDLTISNRNTWASNQGTIAQKALAKYKLSSKESNHE